jgi:hypothetical protein
MAGENLLDDIIECYPRSSVDALVLLQAWDLNCHESENICDWLMITQGLLQKELNCTYESISCAHLNQSE